MDTQLAFSAVIFDMDGVITKTALTHAAAWKKMFNEYLRKREKEHGEKFVEFTHEADYLPYVDGKPRYKGVASFLESRGIKIPFGTPEDAPGTETICGLGNRKNDAFNEVLKKEGAEVYPSTLTLIKALKAAGIKLGVASSSKNCKPVLERVNLLEIFDARVDGIISEEMQLQGKPEPDIFTTACDRMKIAYRRSIVIEDAIAGVKAGIKGNFGLVIGIARENNTKEMQAAGADIVINDLEEIGGIDGINKTFINNQRKRNN